MNNTINRLIIIGNGFDLAHGMKTKYKDFVNGYLKQRINEHRVSTSSKKTEDKLMSIIPSKNPEHLYNYLDTRKPKENIDKVRAFGYEVKLSPFFETIIEEIENKNWVDIEYEYYKYLRDICNKLELSEEEVSEKIDELSGEMKCITSELVKYLQVQNEKYENTKDAEMILEIIRPLRSQEIARTKIAEKYWKEFVVQREQLSGDEELKAKDLEQKFFRGSKYKSDDGDVYKLFPEKVFLLNFNYTTYIEQKKFDIILPYLPVVSFDKDRLVCHIHGDLNDENSIIFGYGDDSDEMYKELLRKYERLLENDKTDKYNDSSSYENFLNFIKSAPFQVCIMGHSCGISDRTLLNTIFQHENCVSIKPYYWEYSKDKNNYQEIYNNICFDDETSIGTKIVCEKYCEPLPQPVEDNE